ncbi:hypothetical protein E2562_005937 [Oryza meyeriana var. granulata]|uniref:Uncharacterized protein n=1 Tax=Oryza meyeriana var. granulata TaxID=110450 RepID=A0A6G1DUN7_9ORYZ|nr:hypothetical protein E2562_005937 [Oryza meyeriana var. granulata]
MAACCYATPAPAIIVLDFWNFSKCGGVPPEEGKKERSWPVVAATGSGIYSRRWGPVSYGGDAFAGTK